VLLPVMLGLPTALFHDFEPFGTAFYWSPSIFLWTIAGGILAASAIIPRFYCRYSRPLGAPLAIGSILSPFRIRRVEQCSVCTVCESKWPNRSDSGTAPRLQGVRARQCVRAAADRSGRSLSSRHGEGSPQARSARGRGEGRGMMNTSGTGSLTRREAMLLTAGFGRGCCRSCEAEGGTLPLPHVSRWGRRHRSR